MPMVPKEVHWSNKGKGGESKGGKGKGERRDEVGQTGGRSNKQRLYNLEHDQAENLINTERLRADLENLSTQAAKRNEVALRSELYELTTKYIKLAQSVDELLQDKHNRDGRRNQGHGQEKQEWNRIGELTTGERRRKDGSRREADEDKSRRRT